MINKFQQQAIRDRQRGNQRTLSRGNCGRCGLAVDRGLDGHMAALSWTVDPRPLSPIEELMALLAGLATFDLLVATGSPMIQRRDDSALRAGRRDWTVIAEHRC